MAKAITKKVVSKTTEKPAKTKTKTKTKIGEVKEKVEKIVHLTPRLPGLPDHPRAAISTFMIAKINEVEAKTHMVSNVSKYMDPLSTGVLCFDWLFNGGAYNGFMSVSGPETSAKSTFLEFVTASGIRNNLLFNAAIDAEGTKNDEYATAIFAMLGLSFPQLDNLPHKPYRYYKENVIETAFDYMHGLLRTMPQKIWLPNENSWAYVFDKRDANEAKKMEIYGVKAEKSLSRHDKYICLTDYSGLEAAFYVDSFAAMVTESDDDGDQKSRRRAAEASAFSENLRRVSARISNRGCLLLGANQLRQKPNVMGRADPFYEPGGDALKFYSAQRARFAITSSNIPGNDAEYNKNFRMMAEPSVVSPGHFDLYDYRRIRNTKNKMGNPKKETWARVWVADHTGQAHGFDPAFDLFNYLLETKQLIKNKRKLKFNLRKSAGSNRASLLNSLPDFTESDLKRLTLSEIFDGRELKDAALKGMHLTKTVGLRNALFEQVKKDKTILAIKTAGKIKEVDLEDAAVEY